MRKKLIISLSVVFGFIAVLLILFWTLFGLSKVTVSFSTTLENLTATQEEIVNAGKFRKGASVLFEGKKKSIRKIEEYVSQNENFAYIKVENIETVFPNKFVIHISEREELFAISTAENYLICDRDLRVLRVVSDFESTQTNAILLEGLTLKSETIKIGDFLNCEEKNITKLYSAFVQSNRNLNEQRSKFQKIEVSHYLDGFTKKEYVALELHTFSGKRFEICNIDFALANKIKLMYAVETSIYSQKVDADGDMVDAQGNKVFFKKLDSGEFVKFNEDTDDSAIKISYLQVLSNCKIKVDNLTLSEFVHRTENDIYYCLMSL